MSHFGVLHWQQWQPAASLHGFPTPYFKHVDPSSILANFFRLHSTLLFVDVVNEWPLSEEKKGV